MWIKVQGKNELLEVKTTIFLEERCIYGAFDGGVKKLGEYSPKVAKEVFREIWLAIVNGRNWFEMPEK